MVVMIDGVQAAMDVDNENISNTELNSVVEYLVNNAKVEFSSQQRGDNDLTVEEKRLFATKLYNSNKNLFLVKFGKFLNVEQLNTFDEFCNGTDKGIQIKSILVQLQEHLDKGKMTKLRKNRRYQALQDMISTGKYFSESEMMKWNPLLYNELIGQYLTEEERRARDKATDQETLVQILMEGIERDDARELRKKQVEYESNAMEEEDDSSNDEVSNINSTKTTRKQASRSSNESPEAGFSRWGECDELAENRINHDEFYAKSRTVEIASKQKALFRTEFISLMHQSFLEGHDDFDYENVDNNESYDNLEIITQDEEDKYFDSEEANDMDAADINTNSGVSSEDELEIFMSRLQKAHPAIGHLTNDFKKL